MKDLLTVVYWELIPSDDIETTGNYVLGEKKEWGKVIPSTGLALAHIERSIKQDAKYGAIVSFI